MKRRTLFLGATAAAVLLVAPAALSAPVPFGIRELESIVFGLIYDGYRRQYRPPSQHDQLHFYWEVRAHLRDHFDTVGWPTETPRIFVLPPDEYVRDYADCLGGSGFIGCDSAGGEPQFWELRRGGWTHLAPAMFSVKPAA